MNSITCFALATLCLAAYWQGTLAAAVTGEVISSSGPYLPIKPSAQSRSEGAYTVAALPMNQKFFLGTEKLSWYEANYYCGLGNLKLVQLISPVVAAELRGFLGFYGLQGKHYWTGGNRFNTQHIWYWNLNSYSMSYTNWALQEPANYTMQKDCIKLWGKTNEWFSEDCDIPYDFICQKY